MMSCACCVFCYAGWYPYDTSIHHTHCEPRKRRISSTLRGSSRQSCMHATGELVPFVRLHCTPADDAAQITGMCIQIVYVYVQ